jgi:hypothetical protein
MTKPSQSLLNQQNLHVLGVCDVMQVFVGDFVKKTKLMYLNTERLPVIFVDGKQLDTVDSFNYIGSCITTEDGAERDIKVRIGKARSAFIRLGNIWKTAAFSRKTKLKIFNSCVFLRLVLWKLESLLMSLSVILQHSEPYRSIYSTQLL